MIIIGITGTLGAGKGTIVEYLVAEKHFAHYSVRSFLLDEIRRRGLPENRDSMYRLANELRAQHGASYVTDQLYRQALQSGRNCVIESIRTTGEVESLRKNPGFVLLAVDADPLTRYHRIVERNSETDRISFETFLENENREMKSNDPSRQNLRACIRMADRLLDNNGSRGELLAQVEKVLKEIVPTG
ncbi:MAG TPA: AAA family ATPase [Bacteroidales bacterium]|nr:AAA family ATPase [Bacteroidales bacterium]